MRDPAPSVLSSSRTISASQAPSWRALLAPYAQPHLRRSLFDISTSLVPYLGLLVAMYALFDVTYWLVLAASVPAAGFLVRTYIVFHDCAHGSFLRGASRTNGSVPPAGCWSSPRFNAGVISTSSTTRHQGTSIGVASGTC